MRKGIDAAVLALSPSGMRTLICTTPAVRPGPAPA
jgi:hypothetical protein